MNILLRKIKKLAFDSRLKNQYTQYALDYVKKEFGKHYEEEMNDVYHEYIENCERLEMRYDEDGKDFDDRELEKEAKQKTLNEVNALAYAFVSKTLNDDFVKQFNEHFSNKSNIPEDVNSYFKREELQQYIDFDQITTAIEKNYKDYIEDLL